MDKELCILSKEEITALEEQVQFYTLSNGKKLAFHEYGNPNGRPIIFMHGSGSHVHPMLWHKPGEKYGFRIIVPDRPGVAQSDYQHGWSIQSYASQVIELADFLKLDKFGIAGISGGGPTLMAVAYQYPQRLHCVIDLACSMPLYINPSIQKTLGFSDRLYARIGTTLPLSVFKFPFYILSIIFNTMKSPKTFQKMFSSSLSAADKEIFAIPEFQYLFMQDFKELFRNGATGPAHDAQTNYKDWGFKLSDISVPIEVFHGTDDRFIPYKFSEYLASQSPQVTLNPIHGAGHFYHLAYGNHILRLINEKLYKNYRPDIL